MTQFERAKGRSIGSSFGAVEIGSASDRDLIEENERLRQVLSDLVTQVEDGCDITRRTRRQVQAGAIPARSAPEMRRELDSLTMAVGRKKMEIDKRHQGSSVRVIEDQIKALRKKLETVETDIASNGNVASQQQATLSRTKSSALMQRLEEEIANQRRVHSELRRANTDVEPLLRVKQRVCAQLDLQAASKTGVESSRRTARQRSSRQLEIELFEKEAKNLETEIFSLKSQLIDDP